MRHLKSLREYIAARHEIGEVQEINKEVDWNLEIGAISRRCYETGAAAPLFNTICGIEKGFRVLGAPAGVSRQPGMHLARLAVSLGLDPRATGRKIVDALVDARNRAPIPPRVVASGPCKENIVLGDNVDLLRLPAPWLHGGDGGRFLNTYGIFVAQTPDKTWTNWSIARAMLIDKNRMSGIVAPQQHLGMIWQQWKDRGEAMPFALALGAEPFVPFVGGMPIPAYVNESDFVGAYFGEPIDVVKCETQDLYVPATSEIVIEGTLSVSETVSEGPMGEYAGYLWPGAETQKPVYHVTAMTYRNDPILPVSVAGMPPEENHTAWGVPNAAEIVHLLREKGFPVVTAWSPFESANHWFVITVERDWHKKVGYNAARLCREIGDTLLAAKCGVGMPKYLVMNDDIDPTDIKQVVWAFATRNYPGSMGETLYNEESVIPLVAYLKREEKSNMHSTKVVYNCLPPEDWGDALPQHSSFAGTYPQAVQDKVLANWQAYGFAE